MAEFYGSVMTNQGVSLLAAAIGGTAKIQFTSFVAGDGTYTEQEREAAALMQRTALKSQKQTTSITSVERPTTGSVVLNAILDNTSLAAGYYVNEVGIYAKNSLDADAVPVLYAIAVAKSADYMPPYNGLLPATIREKFITTVSNSAEITIVSSGAYADAEDLGDISLLETTDKSDAVSAINEVNEVATGAADDIARILVDSAAAHNAIYRGKSLGSSVTAEQWQAISNGTFEDLYIGDYWTIGGINYRIAAFDYWLHYGDTECTDHHVVIVPDENMLAADGSTTHYMNSANDTTGGYVGSGFYSGTNKDSTSNTAKATCKSMAQSAFGSAHILSHREYLTNAITSGYASAGSWYDSDVEMMNEVMVYGTDFFTPHNSLGATIPNTHTVGTSQLPLFAHDHSRICNRAAWWLRGVVSSSHFACVASHGSCDYYGASNANIGVRPAFGIC